VLSGGHLHAPKIQKVLLTGFQVVDIEGADDLFPLDCIAGIAVPDAGAELVAAPWAFAAPAVTAKVADAPAVVIDPIMKSRRSRRSSGLFDMMEVLTV
jgi:hypothetical protein